MNWMDRIQEAVNFVEAHLLEKIRPEHVANRIYYSNSFFQQTFNLVTGYTFGEYVKLRRLTLAAEELLNSDIPVTDMAFKYGYETPEAFTKAFKRTHGVTPSTFRHNRPQYRPFERLTVNLIISGGYNMSCKLIPHVPKVSLFTEQGSYLTSFIGSLYAALCGMGEKYEYGELLMLSGAGNRLCWTDGDWVFGNEYIGNCEEDPFAPYRRVLTAVGFRGVERQVTGSQGREPDLSRERIRRDFVESIDKGIPVIARGIIGDCGDYCVVYGYQNDGETIVGWNYYQADNGYAADQPFVKADWMDDIIEDYIILTERTTPLPVKERSVEALKAVYRHTHANVIRGRKVGLAAWESMLTSLEHDDFSDIDIDKVKSRFIIYCDALCQIHERSVVLPYYERLAMEIPAWSEHLTQAIEAWRDCSGYGGFLWTQGLSFSEEGYGRFRDAMVRKLLADEGRRCMQREVEAIGHIGRILEMEQCL